MAEAGTGLDETRMSIGEHLEELRWHVLRAVITVFLLLCVALYFQDLLFQAATWPHRRVAQSVRRDRVMADASSSIKDTLDEIEHQDAALSKSLDGAGRRAARLREQIDPSTVHAHLEKLKNEQADLQARIEALERDLDSALDDSATAPATLAALEQRRQALIDEQKTLRERVQNEALAFLDQHARVPEYSLTQLSYTEAFMASLKLCLVVALFVGSPLVVREMWSFVAKGLYPHERRYVRLFGPLSFFAFLLGGAFGYFVLIPVGLKFLISYASSELVGATIAVGDYLSLFIVMTLIMGAIFELPLVMVFTTLLGVTNAPLFRRFRRHFLLGAFVASAILTPTPDPFTLCLMAIPLYGLFELGIFLSAMISQRAPAPHAPPAPPPRPAPAPAPPPAPARPAASTPAPAAPPPPVPPPAPALVIPTAPPPATVARSAAPAPAPPAAPAPPPADEPLIGGGDDEEPALDIGADDAPGPGAGYFDPSLEEPEFEQMGRQPAAPASAPTPAGPPAPPADSTAGQADEPIGG